MNTGSIYFFEAVTVFLAALVAVPVYFHRRKSTSPYGSWEDLLARITSVDRYSIELIAQDIVDESGLPKRGDMEFSLDPSRIWPLVGGLEGLEVLSRNSAVLVDLVFYVQQWYPEAIEVAEQLRLNTREIEWHIGRLRGAAQVGKLEAAFPEYAQRVVATYYLMTRHVLSLYEGGNLPGLAALQSAI